MKKKGLSSAKIKLDRIKKSVTILNMKNMLIEKLKFYMKKTGLSQRQLAKVINVNEYTLSRWFTGKNDPSPLYVRIIEKVVRKFEM